uniref:Uncharacterized protein n=1 Tax=Oryza glumipatula TaxID=40148 RepID=A0A0E0BPD8_9ORYZ
MAHAAKTSTQAPCTAASTGFHASPASLGWCGGAPWPRALGRGRPARRGPWWGSWGAELDAAQKCGPAAESTMASVLNPCRSATIVVEVASRCRRRLHRRQSSPSTAVIPEVAIIVVWIRLRPTSVASVPTGFGWRGAARICAASAASAYASLGYGCRLAVVVAIRRRHHRHPLRLPSSFPFATVEEEEGRENPEEEGKKEEGGIIEADISTSKAFMMHGNIGI